MAYWCRFETTVPPKKWTLNCRILYPALNAAPQISAPPFTLSIFVNLHSNIYTSDNLFPKQRSCFTAAYQFKLDVSLLAVFQTYMPPLICATFCLSPYSHPYMTHICFIDTHLYKRVISSTQPSELQQFLTSTLSVK